MLPSQGGGSYLSTVVQLAIYPWHRRDKRKGKWNCYKDSVILGGTVKES